MQSKPQWVYGKHAVKACLENPNRKVIKVVAQSQSDSLVDLAKGRGIKVEPAPEGWFDKEFHGQVHQKIAALVECRRPKDLDGMIEEGKNIIILDLITDPHNLGAILRSAAVFGIGGVIVQNKGTPQESSVISKAASGAAELIPLIRETNLARTIERLKKDGYWCIALTEHGDRPLDSIDMGGRVALIIGGEGDGIRRLILEKSDFKAYIPNTARHFSVLNAAQAATIAMYELAKFGGKQK
ncbi:MAG: 23S rRNA (guanosine(2251)-2'-O)-methyltransferase RlmB [Holosporales bacterium]|jgi:23S rRNA (guanosine2251-2'-O)-methyltransferase|nr:23S rRNA (guanosine(2251)-2'-O)-methyltransferase RlmB [Holosporales bacterium]